MKHVHRFPRRLTALFLVLAVTLSLFPTAFAGQMDSYHDPAEHWQQALDRTDELDANAVVTQETFYCAKCDMETSFLVYRTPEYTRSGETALNRNVKYSDGTCADGKTQGNLDSGTPGVNAYYTGHHWTKAICQHCGMINSNMGLTGYPCGRNVYWLFDCYDEFYQELPQETQVAQVDSQYHQVTTTSGRYCGFCYGTFSSSSAVLERHHMETAIRSELGHQRFVEVETCADCGYTETSYIAAKAVVADYFGVADGQPHTVTVSDLSENGVTTSIRYGHTADGCTLSNAPNYTEAGDYPVYYEITYRYAGADMTENGVAYVHLRDEGTNEDGSCACGCGNPDCGCHDPDCDGSCCVDKGCGNNHNWMLLDSVEPTCLTLGYDRYLCLDCGMLEQRNYQAALGHDYQSVVIREATCETSGKVLEICERCGDVKETTTPKGEHSYATTVVPATCTSPGYTLRTCSVCGERRIEDITPALAHNYVAKTTPATCESGGRIVHICEGCGSSFVTDYTDPLGHSWDEGTEITGATCSGEGVTEYRCTRCGVTRLEGNSAEGHVPGDPATCTQPQVCTKCGAVIANALGHDYREEVTTPTCTEMGYTTCTCVNCGHSYKTDYTKATGHTPGQAATCTTPQLCTTCGATLAEALGHDYQEEVTAPTCTELGYTTHTCANCGRSYKTDYTSATGHVPGQAATCTTPQLCTTCGAVLAEALGHDYQEEVIAPTCTEMGCTTHTCANCGRSYKTDYTSATGHVPGQAATCTTPQLCTTCDAVLTEALGHDYREEVTAPTCTEPGCTTHTCANCGDTYRDDYTEAAGHQPGDWIIDREPTTDSEGSKHKECEVCGEKLEEQPIEKIYKQATTDSKGEAIVGGYLVIVTDTDTKNPVAGATVTLHEDQSLSIRLPSGRLLDYADQTTIQVQLAEDKSPVADMNVSVTDRNNNFSSGKTDAAGQLTVPGGSDTTNEDGKGTVGWEDADGDRWTLTVKVEDHETKRPIENAEVTIGKTGTITVTLPEGTDMDEDNRITVTVTDQEREPQEGLTVTIKGDLGQKETGETDEDGKLTVPAVVESEYHGAYVVGYTDGTFGPDRNMARSEAAAIFARLLAQRNGERITGPSVSAFEDVPADAWYAGYVSYLARYGITVGCADGLFHGDESITRAEFTAMAVRFFDAYGDGDPAIMAEYGGFGDVSPGHWAAGYIADAARYGWVVGYGDGTFHADDAITRAEVVTIVNRLLGREADQEYITDNPRGLVRFPDVLSGYWAYYDILEAANGHQASFSDDGELWAE